MKDLKGNKLYAIERCRNCPNAVVDLERVAEIMQNIFDEVQFDQRQSARLQTDRPLHHQIFRAAIAGCPNSCSQPQIKDFGVQGQMVPAPGAGCSSCGICASACLDGCITLATDGPVIDRDHCLNCGVCIRQCPTGAMGVSGQGCRVLAGGKLGRRPRLATVHLELAGNEQLGECLREMLEMLFQQGSLGERLGELLERSGVSS